MNKLMFDSLDWEIDDNDCDWDEFAIDGYTEGWAWVYGRHTGNSSFSIIRRESDGRVAFPPENKNNPYSSSDWLALAAPDRAKKKKQLMSAAIARAAKAVPDGVISAEYQIRLPEEVAKDFKDMNPIERGKIILTGFRSRS
jgi:hypothetical protein